MFPASAYRRISVSASMTGWCAVLLLRNANTSSSLIRPRR